MLKPFVFVLMPFDNSFDDIYKLGIKAACEECETYCERVDEQIFDGNMIERIYNQINKADLIIADMSGKNPNVFYETGYAHALNKRVILLTGKAEDIPFDLKQYPHLIYDGKILKLKDELKRRIDWFKANTGKTVMPNDVAIELFFQGSRLSTVESNRVDYKGATWNYQSRNCIHISLHNNSTKTFDSHLKIGIIVRHPFKKNNLVEQAQVLQINEHSYLHISKDFSPLFPQAWDTLKIDLMSDEYIDVYAENLQLTVRLFMEYGVKDYELVLNCKPGEIDKVIF